MEEYEIEVSERFLEETRRRSEKKSGEVVMVFLRPGNRVLLNTKAFYLDETYRLPTGSIEKGETPDAAFKRETLEETGLDVTFDRKLGTIHWTFRHGDRTAEYYSHVYLIPETTAEPVPLDRKERISGYMEVEIRDLCQVGEQLMSLPSRWHDWGRFRGLVHTYVCERLRSLLPGC